MTDGRASGGSKCANINAVAGGSVKGDSDDGVQTETHGAFKVVGLAILDNVGDNENRDGKGDSLDWNMLALVDAE